MNIERITLQNFLGLYHANFEFARRTLICGPNGSGKSTLIDAVRFALLGEPGRVRLKKDYRSLLPPGAQTGEVVVTIDGRDIDRQLPSGNPRGPSTDPPMGLEQVLDAPRFGRMDTAGRRRLLLAVTGTSITGETIAAEVKRRGLDLERFARVRPVLRSGLDAAAQECARQATEARGAWRAVTAETYGAVKAATWRAEVEPPPPDELAAAEIAMSTARETLRTADERVGAMKAAVLSAETSKLKHKAEHDLPRLRAEAETAQQQEDEAQAELDALDRATRPAQGLIMPCPACGVRIAYADGTLIVAQDQDVPAPAAHASLPEARQRLTAARARTRAIQASVAAAEIAAAREDTGYDPQTTLELEAQAIAERTAADQAYRQAQAHHLAAADRARAYAQAEERTQAAMGHHIAVCAWSALADALGPEGIPAEILGRALGPVLDRLEQHAAASGWGEAHIDREMDIDLDGRPYALLSESERWRVDAMLAVTLAELSGVGVVMLDRLDVLDLPSRRQAIAWLGGLDLQVIVAATLKAAPTIEGWTVICLESGAEK